MQVFVMSGFPPVRGELNPPARRELAIRAALPIGRKSDRIWRWPSGETDMRAIRAFCCFFTVSALLAAPPAMAQQKSVIRAVPIGDLKVLDPIWSTAYTTRNHAYMVYDTLFALDADNK